MQQQQQGGAQPRRSRAFLAPWLQLNSAAIFPEGGVTWRTEARSGLSGPCKRADAVLYMDNLPACRRYVVLELDDREHRRIGVVEDLFRANWYINARFPGSKAYVVRLNVDGYELSDGERVRGPSLRRRMERLAAVLSRLYMQTTTRADYVRVVYLYYSPDRLAELLDRRGCRLSTVEQDVEYTLAFRPHQDPGYLQRLEQLQRQA